MRFAKATFALVALAAVHTALAQDDDKCHAAHKDEASCDGDSKTDGGCSWCECAALPSSCWSKTNAKKLPAAVYKCHGLMNETLARVATGKLVDSSAQLVASPEIIAAVNTNPKSTWTAGVNANFAGFSVAQMRRLMGAKRSAQRGGLPRIQHDAATLAAVPASFDPRVSRKNCTGPVMDQGWCGSCWAFGAATAITDRLCMKTGKFLQLAPLDLTACDDGFLSGQNGCDGGQLEEAWNYAHKTGLVDESCAPYLKAEGGPVPTCSASAQPCLPEDKFISTPACPSSCKDGRSFASAKHKLKSVYTVDASQLKAELYNNGPVEGAFTVYADFPNYKSGVYQHQSGDALGGHAIKIIGYGTEGGLDYWLVQNSWTTVWGDGGYFKIAAGSDECGIEDDLVAGSF